MHLLRGTLYCLWRRDNEALEDLQRVLDWEGLSIEVGVVPVIVTCYTGCHY